VVHGNVESDAMKDLGKPGAGESHARFDERGLETGHGLGTAAPATCAWTAPDLSATAPALDSDPLDSRITCGASDATNRCGRLSHALRLPSFREAVLPLLEATECHSPRVLDSPGLLVSRCQGASEVLSRRVEI